MLKKLLSWLAPPIDPIDNPYAKATTPDELIAANIIQLLATDFDQWKSQVLHDPHDYHYRDPKRQKELEKENVASRLKARASVHANRILHHPGRDIYVAWRRRGYDTETNDYFTVNGVEIDKETGDVIVTRYDSLKSAYEKAKREAAKAKLAMELNEKKWDLAENLLGMKRTENGALVPVVNVSEGESK